MIQKKAAVVKAEELAYLRGRVAFYERHTDKHANELVALTLQKRKLLQALQLAESMTLRDYFAAQVIAQCHIAVTREEPEPDAEVIRIFAERYARTAYVIADAMLRARA